MNDIEPSVKLTFHKPVIMDRWTGWEIVVDSLPVADFGRPENSTLRLLEGQHEIYLRHRMLPGVYSATQKLKLNLAKGDEVTIKLGIDPKLHLFVAFCIVMTFLALQAQQEALGHIIELSCLVIMSLTILSLVKGFAHRLCIVKPESSLKFADGEIVTQKVPVKADSVVQSLASEFAKNAGAQKSTQLSLSSLTSDSAKNRMSNWSFYLMLFGILLFNEPPPMDAFAMVALSCSAVIGLFATKRTERALLYYASDVAYLLASIMGLAVVFGPRLGNLAPTVFLSISLCIGVAVALRFGAVIAKTLNESKITGFFVVVINSLLAAWLIHVMVPALLQFVAIHM